MRFTSDRLEAWDATSFEELDAQVRLQFFLNQWAEQANQERTLRARCAWMIFFLATFQSMSATALLFALGFGGFVLDTTVLTIVFSGTLTEIFGLFYILAKFLFKEPLQLTQGLLKNIEETRQLILQ
jgi:hypothetical protein